VNTLRLSNGRPRCQYHVATFGQCELDAEHHGPCTVGRAQAWNDPPPCPHVSLKTHTKGQQHAPHGCPECDRIDAREVLRLAANSSELRPLQVVPFWVGRPAHRARMLSWARRVLGIGRPAA
jgi:hypothetical protein